MYPDLSLLKSLLAGLALPRHTPEDQEQSQSTQVEGSTTPVMFPARPTSPWSMSHLAPFLQRIKKDNSEGKIYFQNVLL